jgi:hypothetical protein
VTVAVAACLELVCQECGRAFTPRRRVDAKTCSSPCRQAAYRKRLDRVEREARRWRLQEVLKLRREGRVGAEDALAVVVWPSRELLNVSRQAARQKERAA